MKLPMRTDLQIYMSTESESLAIKTIMLWLCGVLCPRANMPDIVKWMRSFVVCVCLRPEEHQRYHVVVVVCCMSKSSHV